MTKRLRIALLIGSARRYRRDLLCGIAAYARTHGPWSFYHQERTPSDAEPVWLKDWEGDGILAQIENRKLVRLITQTGLPTVDLFGLHGVKGIPVVDHDSDALARLATDHLLERGFMHFAFCGLSGAHYSEQTGVAFTRHLTRMGYDVNNYDHPRQPRAVVASTEEVMGLMHEDSLAVWLQSLPKPVGLMTCNDFRAQQVLNVCDRCNIAVPDEVAVIGADNDEVLCELSNPPLTSIDPNAQQMGYEAAALLEGMIKGQCSPPTEKIRVQPLGLVVRQSTDVLAIADRAVNMGVRFIREHACEGITVSDVCRHVRLSRSTLERRFAKHLGRSPRAEIRNVQIQRVKRFLAETDYPLTKIAQLVGFKHVENICNLFRKQIGQTTGEYRRQSQSERLSRAAADDKKRQLL